VRILVDILHPAHVHFFKHAVRIWQERGHEVLITARDKEMALYLLNAYGFDYTCISAQKSGPGGLLAELLVRDWRLLRIARKFRPDVLTGIAGVSVAHVAFLLRRPSVVFYDTEFAGLSNAITYPFASVVCTPECYEGDIGNKHVRYPGYHELAYLHPRRFEPNEAVLHKAGIREGEAYFIVRFVSWQASHDRHERGFSANGKVQLVKSLSEHGKPLISSEAPLPEQLERHRIAMDPCDIHHLMAFASLYIGESATMASESAVLGVPAIYLARSGRGYTNELEHRYQLVHNFTDGQFDLALQQLYELLSTPATRKTWATRRERMLEERIDVTEWMVEFVENFVSGRKSAEDSSMPARDD